MGNVPNLTFDTDSHVIDNTVPTSLQQQQQNDWGTQREFITMLLKVTWTTNKDATRIKNYK